MEPDSPSKNITIDTSFKTPERVLRSGAPVSPTDSFLSPTSVALARRFRGFTRPDDSGMPSKIPESSEEEPVEEEEEVDPEIPMRSIASEDLVDLTRSIPESVPPTSLPIILGSSSYHRKMVLETAGWTFTTLSPDIDEKAIRTPDPVELPRIIAMAKMTEIDRMLEEEAKNSGEGKREVIVVTSDQVTVFNGVVREKPESEEEAREFLRSYSNDSTSTITAVVVKNMQNGKTAMEVDIANVYWNEIPEEAIDQLIEKGDVFYCAGSFTIEDPVLAPCVRGLEGSVDSVLGLPVDSVLRCIGQVA